MENDEAARIVAQLGMERIPGEGCYFVSTYRSDDVLYARALPSRYGSDRRAGSAIYCLQTPSDFSALHRLATDEIWHYYRGAPLEMLLLYPDGGARVIILGPDLFAGQHPQYVVPRGVWQGSRPLGAYTLTGATLAPAFEYADFELGERAILQRQYPSQAVRIEALTRVR